MATIGTLPGDRLAGLSADLFHKLQSGNITVDELALFTQRKNPFAGPLVFERNEHGHIVVTITGLDLTGEHEIQQLEAAGYRLSDDAKFCFLSRKIDSYDINHRLVAGQEYKIALMPGKEIDRDSDRTMENLRKRGMEKYGYGRPLAGIIPRIRESVSSKRMQAMGFWYVAGLHNPIKDSDGNPGVLVVDRNGDGPWVGARWVFPCFGWGVFGAFAFPVSASNT